MTGSASSSKAPVTTPHWSEKTPLDVTKVSPFFGRLGIKLSNDNYIPWSRIIETALKSVKVFEYCNGTAAIPTDADELANWKQTDMLVQGVLITNMEPEIISQLDTDLSSHELWTETRRIFAGQTMADYTLTISSLINTKYGGGEDDVIEHLTKMKRFRRDLILMNRDIDDAVFACFLRLSMPPDWNYVFAGLVDPYTSKEVETRIKGEHGNRAVQTAAATAFRAATTPKTKGKGRKGKPDGTRNGDARCTNCDAPGHLADDCWAPGGGAEGQAPWQKRKKKPKKGKAKKAEENSSDDSEVSFMVAPRTCSRFGWLKDSGATTHICHERSAFTTFKSHRSTIGGIQDNVDPLEVHGIGDIRLRCFIPGKADSHITLRNVSYCPHATDNLISESRMDKANLRIIVFGGKCEVKDRSGRVILMGTRRGGLYEMDCAPEPTYDGPPDVAFAVQNKSGIDLWHRRMAHLNPDSIYHLSKHGMVSGLDLRVKETLGPCDGCADGKHPQAPFPQKGSRAENILDRLHMDLQGPRQPSLSNYRYSLGIVDCHSRNGWKFFLKTKDQASNFIKDFISEQETQMGKKVKRIRTDGGTEFVNAELESFLKEKGIILETSAPYTQQQNGVAERFNRTTSEHALAMIKDAGLTDGFWPEAHEYASYVRNRSPTRVLDKITPHEAYYGKKPNVSALRIFGSKCHVRVPPEKRKKSDAHSIDGIFCGMIRHTKGYRIWIPKQHKMIKSRNVIVYEKISSIAEPNEILIPAQSEGVSSTTSASNDDPPNPMPVEDTPPSQQALPKKNSTQTS
jgi:transposase InsO family protein